MFITLSVTLPSAIVTYTFHCHSAFPASSARKGSSVSITTLVLSRVSLEGKCTEAKHLWVPPSTRRSSVRTSGLRRKA